MATRKNEPTTEQQNQELTPLQLRFIELLLAGKSITDAARTIGVSRRAACNWLDPAHAVHQEYEQQRRALAYDLQERVKQVHELAMKAIGQGDRKSTRLNSSHQIISYAVFCLKKKK